MPLTTGDNVGALNVANTTTLTAANLLNNGRISSTGGNAALSATTIRGSGKFFTFGTTATPQNLTITGAIANDGATPSVLKITGTNTVNFVPTATATHTGGVQVQKGSLNVQPTGPIVDPLGSATVDVYGWPAQALAANVQPVAASRSELRFTAAGGAITQNTNINNYGLVRAASGTTTVGGVIGGSSTNLISPASFLANTVPGLLEGRLATTGGLPDTDAQAGNLTAARPANNGNFGITLEPRMAQMNVVTQDPRTGWSDNTTWIYTGYFHDADGIFTFAENIDDQTLISIDGVTRLSTNGDRITSTATQKGQRGATLDTGTINTAAIGDLITNTPIAANPNLPAGWHTIEIRVNNGGGGAGPWGVINGFANNYGLGLNPDGTQVLDGANFFRPIDAGDGKLFRTAVFGKGDITVDSGATLTAAGFTATRSLTMGLAAGAGDSVLNLSMAMVSDAEQVNVAAAASGGAIINVAANAVVNVGTTVPSGDVVTVATSQTLSLTGGSGSVFRVGSATTTMLLNGGIVVNSGILLINANGGTSGAGSSITAQTGGTVGGTGSITTTLSTVTAGPGAANNGHIAPGDGGPGKLNTTGSVNLVNNTVLDYDLGAPNGGNADPLGDLLRVAGASSLTLGSGLNLNVTNANLAPGRYELIQYVANDGPTSSFGDWTLSFNGIPAGVNGIDYTFGSDSSDVFLNVINTVPEPTAIGLAALAGFGLLARRRRRGGR
jgi:hypothetical protein